MAPSTEFRKSRLHRGQLHIVQYRRLRYRFKKRHLYVPLAKAVDI